MDIHANRNLIFWGLAYTPTKFLVTYLFFATGIFASLGVTIATPDTIAYVNAESVLSPSGGYAWLLDLLQIAWLGSLKDVSVAFVFSVVIDCCWIYFFYTRLNVRKVTLLLLCAALLLNPIWVVYSVRFSPDLFAKIAALALLIEYSSIWLVLIVWSVLIWFRTPVVLYFASLITFLQLHNSHMNVKKIWLKTTEISWIQVLLAIVMIVVAAMVFFEPLFFYFKIALHGYGGFGWTITNIQIAYDIGPIAAEFARFVLRFVLVFGGRESDFTLGPPSIDAFYRIFILAMIHLVGFASFPYRKLVRSGYILLGALFLTVVASMVVASHFRYIIPFMPIAYMGLAILASKVLDYIRVQVVSITH